MLNCSRWKHRMELVRLGNKLAHHMTLAQLGELSKTIAWISIPARGIKQSITWSNPVSGHAINPALELNPGEGPEEKTPHERLTRLGWLIMHAERYNNKLYYCIRENKPTKQIQPKNILYTTTTTNNTTSSRGKPNTTRLYLGPWRVPLH